MAVGRPVEAVRLAADQVHEAGEVLGGICAEDPLWAAVVPDGAKRTRQAMTRVGRALVEHGRRAGEVYATPHPIDGVAIWLPPESPLGEAGRSVRWVALAGAAGLGPAGIARFVRASLEVDRARRGGIPERHWHLLVLGIIPSHRRRGIGSALLAPMLARADAEALPCGVACLSPTGVLFFRRHGFEVVGDDELPGAGPRFWTMRRNPGAVGWAGPSL